MNDNRDGLFDDDRTQLAGATPAPAWDPAPHNALPIGTRLAEFEITRVLGEGGFGIVYLAYDSSLERHVALKEYMPSSLAARADQSRVTLRSSDHEETFQAGLRSFVNEARILAQFDHPALIKVYRFWEANGTAYMVMPYYEGRTLKQVLAERAAPPDEAWLRALLAPLLDTLELIHAQHCYHRDIAPDNIMMLSDGRPLLLDFGAARRAISGRQQAFTVVFKQNYAPIEQYADSENAAQGPWTDLYALASVLHFAIDGKAPPPAAGRVIKDGYVPLAQRHGERYGAAFLQAIDQALALRPEQRPQSVQQMRALLDMAPGAAVPPPRATMTATPPPQATMAADPGQSPLRAAPSATRRKPYLLGGGAALLAAAGLAAVLMRDTPAPATPSTPAPAPVQAAVPAAAPATPAPFDPATALQEVARGASAERRVTVHVAKPRMRIGQDELDFSVSASHAGHVYVYMIGTERDHFYMLFPNAVDGDNRIAAGQTLQLPRKGWRLGVEGPPGTDQLLVMVSDTPRDFGQAGLKPGELLAEFPIAEAARLRQAYTGATPLFAGTPLCPSGACSSLYGAAAFSIEEVQR